MKKLLLAGIAVAAIFSAPALAADYPMKAPPAPSVFNWTGFYVGANGGYGWNDGDPHANITTNLGGAASFTEPGEKGLFLGAQGGYNWQVGQFVLGVEADFQGANIAGDMPTTLFGANAFSDHRSVRWFGTARGRVGYAFGQLLVYGTGGFAYGEVNNHVITNGVADTKATQDKGGYAAGGGLEWALDQFWSAKFEYEYIHLSDSTGISAPVIPPNGVIVFLSPQHNSFNTVRVGLNYKFATR